jgi:hypothetical protein
MPISTLQIMNYIKQSSLKSSAALLPLWLRNTGFKRKGNRWKRKRIRNGEQLIKKDEATKRGSGISKD